MYSAVLRQQEYGGDRNSNRCGRNGCAVAYQHTTIVQQQTGLHASSVCASRLYDVLEMYSIHYIFIYLFLLLFPIPYKFENLCLTFSQFVFDRDRSTTSTKTIAIDIHMKPNRIQQLYLVINDPLKTKEQTNTEAKQESDNNNNNS